MKRRSALIGFCALALTLSAGIARADWPDRPVKWIVPFGPGGANDLIARVAADGVAKRLGQPVVIENRPGAGAMIGTVAVARAAPDGYTFLIGGTGVITNTILVKNAQYSDSDLVPVGMIAVAPSTIVVPPSVPAQNLAELVAWAKSQGEKGITWATAGSGSTPHFVAEMLREATGIAITIVPYRSGNDGVNAVLSGSVSATSEASIVVLPQIQGGLLRGIATTYTRRISAYPSLPTTAEQGFPTVQIGHWAGLLAPRGTPQAVIERMNAAIQEALKTPEVKDRLTQTGIETAGGSVAEFANFISVERERLKRIAERAKISAE